MRRCEEEQDYLRKQQAEVEHKLEVVCKTEADAKAEAKHAQLRYEDRDHELSERAALLCRQETELVRQPARQENFTLFGCHSGNLCTQKQSILIGGGASSMCEHNRIWHAQ